MTPAVEILTTVAPVVAAMGAAATAVWRYAVGRIDASEARYELRIVGLEKRVREIEQEREAIREELTDRWLREVRRGAALAAAYAVRDASPTPPETLPAPDWEERTATRDVRALIERDELLKAYAQHESQRPPRRKLPSRS